MKKKQIRIAFDEKTNEFLGAYPKDIDYPAIKGKVLEMNEDDYLLFISENSEKKIFYRNGKLLGEEKEPSESELKEQSVCKAQKYLRDTDHEIIKSIEKGKKASKEFIAKREEARKLILEVKNSDTSK